MSATDAIKSIREQTRYWYGQSYPSPSAAFAHVALQTYFELGDEETLEATDVASTDATGIAAFRHDADNGQLLVVQGRYAGRKKTFDEGAVFEFERAWDQFVHLGGGSRPTGQTRLSAAAREYKRIRLGDENYPVGLYLFAAGDFSPAAIAAQTAFNRAHADQSIAMHLIDLGQIADAQIQNASRLLDEPIGWRTLRLKASFEFQDGDSHQPNTLVAAIDGQELAKVEREFHYRIFQRNVRFFLTAQKRENKGMAATLRDPESRKRFWFYNNGISIVCKQFRVADDRQTVRVEDLQIVNGCQTTTTLGENLGELSDPEASAHVLVRIIEAPDEDLQSDISLYNNRQNAVSDRDLLSNDRLQTELQAEFDELDPPWYYEIKRGEWRARVRAGAATNDRYGSRRLINEKAAQAAYAFYFDPGVARARKAALFVRQTDPSDKGLYEQVFNGDTTAEWLLLPAQLASDIAQRRTTFLKDLKDARAASEPDFEQASAKLHEWIKFADQFLLGAIGFYIRQRVTLDAERVSALLKPTQYEALSRIAYAQAEDDLGYLFQNKLAEAEEAQDQDSFVPANFVKGNWREVVIPFLQSRERLRGRVREDRLGSIAALRS